MELQALGDAPRFGWLEAPAQADPFNSIKSTARQGEQEVGADLTALAEKCMTTGPGRSLVLRVRSAISIHAAVTMMFLRVRRCTEEDHRASDVQERVPSVRSVQRN